MRGVEPLFETLKRAGYHREARRIKLLFEAQILSRRLKGRENSS